MKASSHIPYLFVRYREESCKIVNRVIDGYNQNIGHLLLGVETRYIFEFKIEFHWFLKLRMETHNLFKLRQRESSNYY